MENRHSNSKTPKSKKKTYRALLGLRNDEIPKNKLLDFSLNLCENTNKFLIEYNNQQKVNMNKIKKINIDDKNFYYAKDYPDCNQINEYHYKNKDFKDIKEKTNLDKMHIDNKAYDSKTLFIKKNLKTPRNNNFHIKMVSDSSNKIKENFDPKINIDKNKDSINRKYNFLDIDNLIQKNSNNLKLQEKRPFSNDKNIQDLRERPLFLKKNSNYKNSVSYAFKHNSKINENKKFKLVSNIDNDFTVDYLKDDFNQISRTEENINKYKYEANYFPLNNLDKFYHDSASDNNNKCLTVFSNNDNFNNKDYKLEKIRNDYILNFKNNMKKESKNYLNSNEKIKTNIEITDNRRKCQTNNPLIFKDGVKNNIILNLINAQSKIKKEEKLNSHKIILNNITNNHNVIICKNESIIKNNSFKNFLNNSKVTNKIHTDSLIQESEISIKSPICHLKNNKKFRKLNNYMNSNLRKSKNRINERNNIKENIIANNKNEMKENIYKFSENEKFTRRCNLEPKLNSNTIVINNNYTISKELCSPYITGFSARNNLLNQNYLINSKNNSLRFICNENLSKNPEKFNINKDNLNNIDEFSEDIKINDFDHLKNINRSNTLIKKNVRYKNKQCSHNPLFNRSSDYDNYENETLLTLTESKSKIINSSQNKTQKEIEFISKRLYENAEIRNKKRLDLQDNYFASTCPFTPEIISKGKDIPNINNFFKRLQNWVDKRNEKYVLDSENLKYDRKTGNRLFSPQINNTTIDTVILMIFSFY